MTVMTENGKVRKSLAEQIDRLDSIPDGLADGLQEAVADAVKRAVTLVVQEAVRGVLAELLTNPDLLALLRGSFGPAVQSKEPVTEPAARPTRRTARGSASSPPYSCTEARARCTS